MIHWKEDNLKTMETDLDYWNVKPRMNGIANWNWEAILHYKIFLILVDWRGTHYNISSSIYSVTKRKPPL